MKILSPVWLAVALTACTLQNHDERTSVADGFPAFPPENVDRIMDMRQMWAQLGIELPETVSHADDPFRPLLCRPTHESMKFWTDVEGYAPASPANYMIKRSQWGEWTNFTETEEALGMYSPLDPLVFDNGRPVKNLRAWKRRRSGEILRHCQEEVWGIVPEEAEGLKVFWEESGRASESAGTNVEIMGVACRVKDLVGMVDTSCYPQIRHAPMLRARLYQPVCKEKTPVIVQLGYSPEREPSPVALKECLGRGWGYMLFDCAALQPDNGAFMTDYLIGLLNRGNWRKPQDWGAMAAWSWGVSRLMDRMGEDHTIDLHRIGVTGHSRYGKTALLAMVYEPRLAIAYVNCSGVLGAAPIRTNWGENLEVILSEGSYHWAAGNAFRYVGALHPEQGTGSQPRRRETLRTDAHLLLSLAAPRPVFVGAGTTDSWANPLGMYCTCRDASPVYALYGKSGLVMQDRTPLPDKAYIDGTIGFRLHTGGHTDVPDWPAFALFAERQFAAVTDRRSGKDSKTLF